MRRWVDPDLNRQLSDADVQKYRVFISDEKQWKPRARRGGMRAGPWDKVDPIANAVVGLVKASNATQSAFDNYPSDEHTTAAIDAALEAREAAIKFLIVAHREYGRTHGWTAYVSGW
jgi:hypothetical protein